MTTYLGFRCFTDAILFCILEVPNFLTVSARTQTLTYIYTYDICYFLGAIAVFVALQEVFKAAMDPVPGLQRLGLMVFRWASVVMLVAVLVMVPFPARNGEHGIWLASSVSIELMRVVSVLEIGLLVFLAFSVHTLGRSFRGRVFGIGLGFGLEAAGELISSVMLTRTETMWSLGNVLLMSAGIAALCIWGTYFLLPETAEDRAPVTLPVTSPLLRWNAIASALGQRPAHVALGATSSAFFLQDVEKVVDKFLAKAE
ncbi:MAG TPA: hypothetical protein VGT04_16300 [Acidobacteriaceae bacterium]|nr:hypothetical protein [Acidobacteriaceae bacterium]